MPTFFFERYRGTRFFVGVFFKVGGHIKQALVAYFFFESAGILFTGVS